MPTWLSSLAVYADRRIVAIFFLGVSSGLPLALTGATLGVWLRREGVDLATIGLISAVTIPYALKFLWAPIIDRLRLPVFTRVFGRRRGWVLVTQIMLIAAIIALGTTDPLMSPGLLAALAALVAFSSASQDVVIDAYRIELLEERLLGVGAASVVFGYRVGMLATGAGALYLADQIDWSLVYTVLACLVLIGVVTILLSPEPSFDAGEEARAAQDRVAKSGLGRRKAMAWLARGRSDWFYAAVVMPFAEFATRPKWLLILLFVVFYKFGDSLAGVMTGPFLVDIGFSNTEIANIAKLYGFAATMGGLFIGGWLISTRGILTVLWVGGFLQLASNLLFAIQAMVGHDSAMLAVAIGGENLAGGVGTAALVAYLSSLCNVAYTATQYALLSSFMATARTLFVMPGGWFAEMLDWMPFFIMTTFAAIPGLLLLLWLSLRGGVSRAENPPAA